MAIVEGAKICTPPGAPLVQRIIEAMESLLEQRYRGLVSRKAFLTKWQRLRKALFLTNDYQEFRLSVLGRCGGTCEECRKSPAVHVHHDERVALNPRRALVLGNARGLCKSCHAAVHRSPAGR